DCMPASPAPPTAVQLGLPFPGDHFPCLDVQMARSEVFSPFQTVRGNGVEPTSVKLEFASIQRPFSWSSSKGFAASPSQLVEKPLGTRRRTSPDDSEQLDTATSCQRSERLSKIKGTS